ncbi:Coq4 family protein [Alkalinema pantanalense CENA528]|uniref:Coq4 family protein n=1 Tax=Alkalinema pantanalense TaxID=1620705 RepID=UPI003D6E959C
MQSIDPSHAQTLQPLSHTGLGKLFSVPNFLDRVDRIGDRLGINVPTVIHLEELRQLPAGTLGCCVVEFLEQHHLQPLTTGPRRKQLHDIVHVVTDYGTDPIGEAEVQAFLLGAQFRLAHAIIGLGLLRIIHHQRHALNVSPQQLQQRLWAAYRRGHASRLDVGTWQPEAVWHLPLADVKTILNIPPLA